MTDLQWLIVVIAMFATMLPGSIIFLALRVRGLFNVTVTTPPVGPITVQAPTALLPERVQTTLDAIDAKLTPVKPVLDDSALAALVTEGVAIAERSPLKGPDRFRIAKTHVMERASSLSASIDEADLARRIEAAVAVRRAQ